MTGYMYSRPFNCFAGSWLTCSPYYYDLQTLITYLVWNDHKTRRLPNSTRGELGDDFTRAEYKSWSITFSSQEAGLLLVNTKNHIIPGKDLRRSNFPSVRTSVFSYSHPIRLSDLTWIFPEVDPRGRDSLKCWPKGDQNESIRKFA